MALPCGTAIYFIYLFFVTEGLSLFKAIDNSTITAAWILFIVINLAYVLFSGIKDTLKYISELTGTIKTGCKSVAAFATFGIIV